MKRSIRVGLIALVWVAGWVQAQPPPGTGRPRPPRTINRSNWVGKHVLSPEFMEQVGLRGAQAEQLKAELEEIQAQAQRLEETINREALRQGELARNVLSEPGASVDEIMAIIERIGRHRTEQAKLATRQLVVIRDRLTAEQRKKARELIAAEARRRMAQRAAERAARERAP